MPVKSLKELANADLYDFSVALISALALLKYASLRLTVVV